MDGYVQPGNTIPVTGPTGGVAADEGFFVGQLFVVAASAIAEGAQGEAITAGVVELTKATGTAFAAGDAAIFDVSAGQVDGAAVDDGDRSCGVVIESAGTSATTVKVLINKGRGDLVAAGGTYTQDAADATANSATIDTGLSNIVGFSTTLLSSANVVNASDAVITKSGGDIVVADGSTYAVTAGHIVHWTAVGY